MDNNEGNIGMENYAPIGGQPYDGTMVGGSGKKNLTWLWIVLGVVVLCAIVALVLFLTGVFGGSAGRQGNSGVWALFDYFDQQKQQTEKMMGTAQKEVGERILSEPFEIESELEISSDSLASMGSPINKLSIDLDAKYDLKDLGVKITALGMVEIGAYLIEDELVVDALGEAYSTQIPLDFDADLGDDMPLRDRLKAFVPFVPEDNRVWMDLLKTFATAVPEDLTETDREDVYSPLDDDEVEMSAIITTIDERDLQDIIENFIELMEEDDRLTDQLQDILDDFADFAGIDDVDLDDGLKELEEMAEDLGETDFEFSWTVYQRSGRYVGVSVSTEVDGEKYEALIITEQEGNKAYSYTYMMIGEQMTEEATQITEYNGDEMTFEGETMMTQASYFGEDIETSMDIDGRMNVEKTDRDEYVVEMEVTVDTRNSGGASDMIDGLPEAALNNSARITADAECRFGKGLETLEESRDWNDVYDKDWGDIEDIFKGLENLGGMNLML